MVHTVTHPEAGAGGGYSPLSTPGSRSGRRVYTLVHTRKQERERSITHCYTPGSRSGKKGMYTVTHPEAGAGMEVYLRE